MSEGLKNILRILILSVGLVLFPGLLYGQKPPRPVTVTQLSGLSFGAFSLSGGGTVSVDNAGNRSSSAGIIPLSAIVISEAILRFSGNPGTRLTLTMGPDVVLNGSGGGTMTLHIDPVTDPASPFVLTGGNPATVDLHIGGTITVPGGSPRGTYSGNFTIIFNQD